MLCNKLFLSLVFEDICMYHDCFLLRVIFSDACRLHFAFQVSDTVSAGGLLTSFCCGRRRRKWCNLYWCKDMLLFRDMWFHDIADTTAHTRFTIQGSIPGHDLSKIERVKTSSNSPYWKYTGSVRLLIDFHFSIDQPCHKIRHCRYDH